MLNPIYGVGVGEALSQTSFSRNFDGENFYEAPASRQFDRSKLKLGRVVGRGEFGEVHEGLVRALPLCPFRLLACISYMSQCSSSLIVCNEDRHWASRLASPCRTWQ